MERSKHTKKQLVKAKYNKIKIYFKYMNMHDQFCFLPLLKTILFSLLNNNEAIF